MRAVMLLLRIEVRRGYWRFCVDVYMEWKDMRLVFHGNVVKEWNFVRDVFRDSYNHSTGSIHTEFFHFPLFLSIACA